MYSLFFHTGKQKLEVFLIFDDKPLKHNDWKKKIYINQDEIIDAFNY